MEWYVVGGIVITASFIGLKVYHFLSGQRFLLDAFHSYVLNSRSLEEWEDKFPKISKECDIVISLTTIPERIDKLQAVLKSLLNQSVRPKSINIYIPYRSYRNNKLYEIPPYLKKLRFVTIHRIETDYGPASKSIPALVMFERGQKILVVDDDNIYPDNYVKQFQEASERYPNQLLTATGWRVPEDLVDRPTTLWSNLNKVPPTPVLGTRVKEPYLVDIIQGYSGYLIKPEFFNLDELKNFEGAPEALRFVDDVWLSAHSKVSKVVIPIRRKSYTSSSTINDFRKSSLAKINNWGREDYSNRNNSIGIRHFKKRWMYNEKSGTDA